MTNPIKEIYKWQVLAGLSTQPYDDFLEASFQVEEALEGFPSANLKELLSMIDDKDYRDIPDDECSPKEISRRIVSIAKDYEIGTELPDVDRFDKAIDAIVFAIGSMTKLGLNPQQIQKGILTVNKANMQKLGMHRDEHGKLVKPANFVGPEVELQKILDGRNKND